MDVRKRTILLGTETGDIVLVSAERLAKKTISFKITFQFGKKKPSAYLILRSLNLEGTKVLPNNIPNKIVRSHDCSAVLLACGKI